jgi:putative MFS transporter
MNEHTSRFRALGAVQFHHAGAFWIGVTAVTAGVIAHLPMYWMGRNTGYRLAGMPMDTPMLIGMVAIVLGFCASLYGLYPAHAAGNPRNASRIQVKALDDASLNWAHIGLLLTMAVALTIDVMKPTALAFVLPGMTM